MTHMEMKPSTMKNLNMQHLMMRIILFIFTILSLSMIHLNMKRSTINNPNGKLSTIPNSDMKSELMTNQNMNPCTMMRMTSTGMFAVTPNA